MNGCDSVLIEYMLNFGYTSKDIDKILKSNIIVNLKKEFLYDKIVDISNFLISIGYSKEEIIKIVKSHPRILGLTVSNLEKKIDYLIDNGYSLSIVRQLTVKCPQIFSLSIKSMDDKTNDIMELGYKKDEVIEMIRIYPTIFTFNVLNMKNKIKEIMEFGYSYDEIINMTKNFPQLYSLDIDNIKEKIIFYENIGLADLVMIKKKFLMQSLKLSYARYQYFLSIGIVINNKNFERLFMSEKIFFNTYKVNRDEILELYQYDSSKIIDNIVKERLFNRG